MLNWLLDKYNNYRMQPYIFTMLYYSCVQYCQVAPMTICGGVFQVSVGEVNILYQEC